jgi:hypothetical protein
VSERPQDYDSWPPEVRDLYDRVLRADVEDGEEGAVAAYHHLSGLMRQREDSSVALSAASAIWELTVRFAPEAAEQLSAQARRDTLLGQSIVKVAISLMEKATGPQDRKEAEDLLRRAVTAYPPKGRT